MPDGTINPQKPVTADAGTVIYFRFWGEADMAGRAALLVPFENDPSQTSLPLKVLSGRHSTTIDDVFGTGN